MSSIITLFCLVLILLTHDFRGVTLTQVCISSDLVIVYLATLLNFDITAASLPAIDVNLAPPVVKSSIYFLSQVV